MVTMQSNRRANSFVDAIGSVIGGGGGLKPCGCGTTYQQL